MKNIFEYNDLHFVPVGSIEVKNHHEFLSRIYTDVRLKNEFQCQFGSWDYEKFCLLKPTSESDVFFCLETQALYIPSPNELFGWRDNVLLATCCNKYDSVLALLLAMKNNENGKENIDFLIQSIETRKIVENMLGKQYKIATPDGTKIDFDEVFQRATTSEKIVDSENPFKNVHISADNIFTVRRMREFANMINSTSALDSPIRVRFGGETFVLNEAFNVEDGIVYIGTDNNSRSCSLQTICDYFRAEESTDSWYKPSLCGDSRMRFDNCKINIRINRGNYKITKALLANVCNNEYIYFEVEKL